MATDAWQRTRDGFTALWRRVHPDRAEAITAELDATRRDLLTAHSAGDPDSEQELRAEWQGRIRRLLAANPEAAQQLQELLAEFGVHPAAAPVVTQHATASGHARVYQAGRDQHVTER